MPTGVVVRRCPDLSSLAVVPNRASVGGSVALTATVTSGTDSGTPMIAWSSSTGNIAAPGAASTTFTCTSIGMASVVVAATEDGCTETLTGSVDCVASTAGGTDGGAGGGLDGS